MVSDMARITKALKAEQDAAKEYLLGEYLAKGDTVWCVLRHVSRSGMQRRIDFFVVKGNRPLWLSGHIGTLLGLRHHKDGGLVVDGCGMDMGFQVVHSLCYALWGHDHHEAKGHERSGYQLQAEWL